MTGRGPARRRPGPGGPGRDHAQRPPLRVFPTTLWEYPSQHYDSWFDEAGTLHRSTHAVSRSGPAPAMQGDKAYAGATPGWVIWQVLTRYTREGDTVVDPMCGSGTTLDVCADLQRRGVGFDLAPSRPDIARADARSLPLDPESADFVFVDPPYSTHIDYSDDPACIGRLNAGGDDRGRAYYDAIARVIAEIDRVLKDRRYMALYVSDSFRKRPGATGGDFMPIGFEIFAMLREHFAPVDIVCVARQNRKITLGNWRKAAEEGNFFLRGFNYLFIMKKDRRRAPGPRTPGRRSRAPSGGC